MKNIILGTTILVLSSVIAVYCEPFIGQISAMIIAFSGGVLSGHIIAKGLIERCK
mgnify:CR=1 FL=1